MHIKCTNCGHKEKVNIDLFVKIIGGSMPFGAFGAWVAYLFAGTGFAMPIVIAIITGGVLTLAFQREITNWICDKHHTCKNCGQRHWKPAEE